LKLLFLGNKVTGLVRTTAIWKQGVGNRSIDISMDK
jgi:hypothetical protein